jgi:hypothetical protein
MLLLTRNKNDERETALLGVLWVLSVHFHKQRDPPLAKKKKKKRKKKGDQTELLVISLDGYL